MHFGFYRGCGLIGLLFIFCTARFAAAQAIPANEAPGPVRVQPVVTDVEFAGNDFFSDAELALRVRTTPNRRFLNIPGFTWWLWLYRLGESGALGERVGKALMTGGEAPAYLDSSVVAADVERLRLFYLQEGFRQVRVEADIDTLNQGALARVTFRITPGAPTYIRRVRYEGIDELDADQRRRLVRASLLRPVRTATGENLAFRTRSQRYSEPILLQERNRVLDFLRREGYAAVTRDSIRAIVFPQGEDSFDVALRINPGPVYRFGDVHFNVVGPEPRVPPRSDTIAVYPATETMPGGVVTARIENERKLAAKLLERALQFRPGEIYDQEQLLATKRRLDATGVFAFTDITPLPQDSAQADTAVAPRLDHRFELRTRPRHRVRLESFVLQRSGLTVGENELGTGLGLTYENANAFGGGEAFQVRTTGSVAANVDAEADSLGYGSSLFNSAQAEISTSLTYPYLVAPFGALDRLLNLYDARTRFSLSFLTARREELRLIIRGRGQARARFELQHSPTEVSLVDLFDLTLSNPDTLTGFEVRFFKPLLDLVEDSVQAQQLREDYTRPQVNSALRYTFRSATVNPFLRNQGYSFEAAAEIGGNLPYLMDRFVQTPGAVEGSLPGLPLFEGNRADTRLIYRQYARATVDMRRYYPVARGRVLAWKLTGGFAHPYGRATPGGGDLVPFDRRFYIGGATGVRGWELRQLGPGATETYLGGEIKLEGAVELRARFIRSLLAAEWSAATFVDAGNVWLGPRNPGEKGHFAFDTFYKQIAVGSGLGLRVAWEYLILRFDVAYKVYNPAQSDLGIFPDGLGSPLLHFGIGHAF